MTIKNAPPTKIDRTSPSAMVRFLFVGVSVLFLASSPAEAANMRDGPVQGFALQLPVQAVIRQIVPAGVPVSFEDGIDIRRPVGWHGGPSWQKALNDALHQAGLTARFSDAGVWISRPAMIDLAEINRADSGVGTGPELIAWHLRSATPGRGWVVSPHGTKLGPMEIHEGENHPDLGLIESIRHHGDRWIVQARQGWFWGGPN